MKHITMGTAGHIDHGKTALVKRLTGTDTDRLAAEKDRGMTIDLGFAFLELPSGNSVSIVDVPGHEKFVKTMVAGVTGIDFVMLVVAADEGIKPQTSEHIDILSVLQMKTGIVALTKTDLVKDEIIEYRKEEIGNALKGTSLEGIEILPVSSVSGEGIDELIKKIDELTLAASMSSSQFLFRLPIDRVFTMTGHGTVVTGTISGGSIKKGDSVDLLPEGLSSKVRNIQVRNVDVEEAVSGDRCALNITGVEKEEIRRGTVVIEKGKASSVILVDAVVQMVHGSGKLLHNQRVHLHTGTSSVLARVRIIGSDSIKENEKGYVQLRVEQPIVALRGDKFILRTYSPVRTIGGGKILFHKTKNRKRFDEDSIRFLQISDEGDEKTLIQNIVDSYLIPVNVEKLYRETMIDKIHIEHILKDMIPCKRARYIKETDTYVGEKLYNMAFENIAKEFQKFYKKYPYRYLISKDELKNRVFPLLSIKDYTGLIKIMVEEGRVHLKGNMVGIEIENRIKEILSKKEVLHIKKIFLEEEYQIYTLNKLMDSIKFEKKYLDEILHFLILISAIEELEQGFFVSKEMLLKVYQRVKSMMENKGSITVAQLRDALGISRKLAIIYLEYFDRQSVTKREGNDRTAGSKFLSFAD